MFFIYFFSLSVSSLPPSLHFHLRLTSPSRFLLPLPFHIEIHPFPSPQNQFFHFPPLSASLKSTLAILLRSHFLYFPPQIHRRLALTFSSLRKILCLPPLSSPTPFEDQKVRKGPSFQFAFLSFEIPFPFIPNPESSSSVFNTTTITSPLLHFSSSLCKPFLNPLSKPKYRPLGHLSKRFTTTMNLLNKLGFGSPRATQSAANASIAQGPDDDVPAPGQEFAQFGASCFWGVELAFQRVPGVTKTEVGYTQGFVHSPSYEDVCSGTTNHSEVVRVQFDPKQCSFDALLDTLWARHDPTTLNRQVFKLHLAVNLQASSRSKPRNRVQVFKRFQQNLLESYGLRTIFSAIN